MKVLFGGPYYTKGCGVSNYEKMLMEEISKSHQVYHFKYNFLQNKNPFEIFGLIKKIKNLKPDVIHLQYTPTLGGPFFPLLIYILKKQLKIILNSHENIDVYYRYLKPLKFLLNLYEKIVVKNSDYYIVHIQEHKDFIINNLKLNGDNIKIVNHPVSYINTDKINPNKINPEVYSKYGIPENKKLYLAFFGNIKYKKGIDILLKVVKSLNKTDRDKFNLLIMGCPNKREKRYYLKLKKLSSGLDNITFTGFIEESDLPHILKRLDLIILPYRNCTDSGILYKEVFPHNIPVLASNVGGLKRVGELGIGKNFDGPDDLRKKIREFIINRWDLKDECMLQEAGPQRHGLLKHRLLIKEFDITKICKIYLRLYNEQNKV